MSESNEKYSEGMLALIDVVGEEEAIRLAKLSEAIDRVVEYNKTRTPEQLREEYLATTFIEICDSDQDTTENN